MRFISFLIILFSSMNVSAQALAEMIINDLQVKEDVHKWQSNKPKNPEEAQKQREHNRPLVPGLVDRIMNSKVHYSTKSAALSEIKREYPQEFHQAITKFENANQPNLDSCTWVKSGLHKTVTVPGCKASTSSQVCVGLIDCKNNAGKVQQKLVICAITHCGDAVACAKDQNHMSEDFSKPKSAHGNKEKMQNRANSQ